MLKKSQEDRIRNKVGIEKLEQILITEVLRETV